jgi:tRNA A-37 threonylcarbamoyl transferase component Bud32/predicted esterase
MFEPTALATALGDRYSLIRPLGSGGMATVYLARDTKYDREVAIKVLSAAVAQGVEADRFLREVRITARLNHPHILPLLDSGAAADGSVLYYVMPVAAGESLRDKLARTGALPVAEAVRHAIDVTEALVAAHAVGVVHRDIKPENVLLSGDHAVVVDFGIAKALGDARDVSVTLTVEGTSIGTPAYMSPEQAAGERDVDARTDVYAVGVMLWEMCAGSAPFTGKMAQIIAQKLSRPAPALAPAGKAVPVALQRLVARCLEMNAADRPSTAAALLDELRALAQASAPATSGRTRALALGGAALALAAMTFWYVRDQRSRWVRDTALPTLQRLIEADQLDSAFALAMDIVRRAPSDTSINRYWRDVSQTQSFVSEPAGAVVTRASLTDTSVWIPVATTPASNVRIPKDAWLYRYSKPGYHTVTIMGARIGGSYVPVPAPVLLSAVNAPDSGMVLLSGRALRPTLYGLDDSRSYDLPEYRMDRLEVTNREYKAFVDAGGYTTRRWWDSVLVRDGRPIPFEQAMRVFVDGSGRPGPATWVGGAPPADQLDFPVGGVSWYEARAFARFVEKDLPTVVEWNNAAMPEAARWVVPSGRFESSGPVRGGANSTRSPRGVSDMAGNMREWTLNARDAGERYILGGGWSDPTYLFSEIYTAPEFDRSEINGIRLVRRSGETPDLARAAAPIPRLTRDFDSVKPVDAATFRGYLAQYEYESRALDATRISSDSSTPDWIRETVTVSAAMGDAPLRLEVFLPRQARPPYQTVVIWPASDAEVLQDVRQLPTWILDFVVRSGRAVVYPIYEGVLGRPALGGDGLLADRDRTIRRVNEMRRAVDYAFSRSDFDSTRVAYLGASWGGRMAGTALAVEPRFRAAVLFVAGLGMKPVRPEVDPVNFLPRVQLPTLMLSGKFDSTFPMEASQNPFYRLLGTREPEKKRIVYDLGHFLPRPAMVSETLTWLDRYLGVVAR